MSMFDLNDDQVRALYADAREHAEARILREHMAAMIREAMIDVAHEVANRDDAPRNYFQSHADRLLDRMLQVCNEKGWDRIGRPIMAKVSAQHQMQAAVDYLTTKRMLEPSSWMRDLMVKLPTTQPVDEKRD